MSAYLDAMSAEGDYVRAAILCGQMLTEQRPETPLSHAETTGRFEASKITFDQWLKQEYPEISRPRAYRWMQCAQRVIPFLLELQGAPKTYSPAVEIQLDGQSYPISQVLSDPESDCTEAMLVLRQNFDDFLADKTFSEAAICSLDGESPDSRIARSINGKKKGGNDGQSRKNYPKFFAQGLKKFDSFLLVAPRSATARPRDLDADQQVKIAAAFDTALSRWPEWILRPIKAAAERELRKSKIQRTVEQP